MAETEKRDILVSLLPVAVVLWLVYLLMLWVIDQALSARPVFPLAYYAVNAADAVVVLALVLWAPLRKALGRTLLPLVIVLMSAIPVVTSQLVVLPLRRTQSTSPEAVLLRLLPVLMMALVLTAWQYRWRYVLLYSVGIALFAGGLHAWYYRPGGPSLLPPLTVLVIQTVSFWVVGYFVRALVNRLKKQQSELARANARLVHYASTLEELTITRERNRLARELHDTLAHTLSALSVQLETVKAYWDLNSTAAQEMLGQSLQATRSGLDETRRALRSLRAGPLEDLGLVLALEKTAKETADRAGVELKLSLPEETLTLSPEFEQVIYRVAQEALANIAHHAHAHQLELSLTVQGPRIELVVKDDGIGFDPHDEEKAAHYGLAGMRERALLVKGELTVDSQPGRGTCVRLVLSDKGRA